MQNQKDSKRFSRKVIKIEPSGSFFFVRELNIFYYGTYFKGGFVMTRKQIDASREIRLWIIQVIMPATALVMAIPETRNAMIDGFQNAKRSVKSMFQKS